ncbi:hypothetical protein D0T53_07395 [Dysgonomonas sp. 216]|uniref:hypothetical protein n=1 Tax=Dysgonomonas sp. 216 TaxID=2302934 RepID=UPI001C86A2AE|nr:hypothetical protein [Dysgonomonas sp. 216]NDW18737.1 hypothetical protein [Dysgonomonas sp. 216]
MGDAPDHREYYPILHAHRMDIQRACFTGRNDILLIDGKDIPARMVALNEGLEVSDMLEWKKKVGTRKFCIVHFTGFRY